MKKLPKLSAANQALLSEWKAKLAKALAARGSRASSRDNHSELLSQLTAEIKRLEEESDAFDPKAATILAQKREQIALVNLRLESAEADESAFVGGGQYHRVVSGLEGFLHGILYPSYEEQLAEVVAAYRPFFTDEAGAIASARQAPVLNAWACFFRNIATRCGIASRGETEALLQSITDILEDRLPFLFDNGLGKAAKEADAE